MLKEYLENGEGNMWSYEESCLKHEYWKMKDKLIIAYYNFN